MAVGICRRGRGDDFSGCILFSIVAWDHVSWPGNDYFGGSRSTDDGVKAAATDSMAVLTGIEGHYDPHRGASSRQCRIARGMKWCGKTG